MEALDLNLQEESTLDLGPVNQIVRTPKGVDEKTRQASFVDPEANPAVLRYQYENGEDQSVDNLVGAKRQKEAVDSQRKVFEDMAAAGAPELVDFADGLTAINQDYTKNAVVKEFGRKLANTVGVEAFVISEALNEQPEVGHKALDVIEEWSSKASIVRDIVDQTQAQYDDKSWMGKGMSILGSMVPFADWYARNDAVAEVSGILPGNNLQEQIQYLWSLPVDEIGPTLKEAVDEASKFSDLGGLFFAKAFLEYSSSDQFMDNAFGVLDTLSVAPIGLATKGVKSGVKTARETITGTKAVVKEVIKEGPDAAKIANALGDTAKAAVETGVKTPVLTKGIQTVDELSDHLASIFRIEEVLGATKNLSNASRRKLIESAQGRAAVVAKVLEHGINDINVLRDYEKAQIVSEVLEDIKKVHTSIKDGMINLKETYQTADNINMMRLTIGRTNGEGFKTEQAAKTWKARYLQFKDAEIVQEGGNFFVEVRKPIPAGERLQDIKLVSEDLTPDRGALGRAFYSDSYKVSPQEVKNRRSVSDNAELLGKRVEAMARPLTALSKKHQKELTDVLAWIRDTVDPKTKERRWLDLSEFENKFYDLNGKFPTEAQADAYMATRQINDLDYMLRDTVLLKKKANLGVENWEIKGVGDFEGIQRREIPWGSDDYFRVTAVDADGRVVKSATNMSNAKVHKEFQDLLDRNWTLVQAFEGSVMHGDKSKPMRSTFILTQTPKRSNVKIGQSLNYNPGGHIINKYGYYVKQPQIRVGSTSARQYMGDKTFWGIRTEAEGQQIVEHLNKARELKLSGDEAGFARYLEDHLPEMSAKDWRGVNLNEPFVMTRKGHRTTDHGFSAFDKNLEDNMFNLKSQLSGRFVGERDAYNVKTLTAEENAVVRVEPTKVLNPFDAMTQGLRDSLDQRVMGDYLERASDTFVREFGHLMDDASKTSMWRNPIPYLLDPKFKTGAEASLKDSRQVAKAQELSKSISYFLGIPDSTSRNIQKYKESLMEWAITSLPRDSWAQSFVEERLVHTIKDPSSYFRAIAFHTKMGLFNPKQLFLQAQILTQIGSISGWGQMISKSMPAMMYTQALDLTANPAMLKEAARRMSKFGWKESEFIEAYESLMQSGWSIVGSTNAWRDVYEGTSIIHSKWGRMLDAGTAFFKKGEQIGRETAWYSSYLDWRKANPTKALDREAIQAIRLRASDLTANMTRDMNAKWQRGFAAVPTQFWGFQARVFEQMMSPASRLSKMEKARLFAGLSLMYGVPVGVGAGTMVWPVNESVKKYLMESGMDADVESNPLYETMRDGILSTAIEFLSGMDLDTSNYGPAGMPTFKDILRGDSSWYEMFGGASAGIIAEMLSPGFKALKRMVVDGNEEEDPFIVDGNLMMDLLDKSQVSSAKNVVKLWKALHTGKWISGNETVLGDVTAAEAWTSAITGLDIEDVSDTFLRLESSADVKEAIAGVLKDSRKEYQRARRALDDGDMEAYALHTKRAKALAINGGLDHKSRHRAFMEGFYPQDLEDSSQKRMEEYVLEYYKRKKGQ